MLQEFDFGLTKRDVMQVRGERRCQSSVEAGGWSSWQWRQLGQQRCVGRHKRDM